MRSLNTWIEAQLKRGYSRKQIKDALIRKGYSPKAVAEVDKISYSAELQNKKIPKISYKALIGVMIIIAVLIWLFNALPFFSKQSSQNIAEGQKPAEQAIIENQAEQPSGELQPVNSYTIDEAGQKAELYSGIVTKVSETSITLESTGKSREFPISRDAPPRFVVGSPEDDPSKLIELTGPLGVGMKINQLNLFISPSGEKRVSGAFISP